MIIECEFTNASDFVREKVSFLTQMSLMIDSDNQLFWIWWDDPLTIVSLFRLKKVMHDSEYRIHLDREGLLITMARCLDVRWTFFFISINWRQGERICLKIRQIQRAFRRRFMRRRLCVDKIFSKIVAVKKILKHRLHDDVVQMILLHYIGIKRNSFPHLENSIKWVKSPRDGQIYD
jgi:hypothetical protein